MLQIVEHLNLVAVITPKDDNLVRPYAEAKGYPVLESVKDLPVRDYQFDLGIMAHSFEIVPDRNLKQASIGWLGYHPSLLPRHRGKDSIQWALDAKDVITGGTIYWLTQGIDKGDIAYQDWIWLDHSKTAKQVWDEELMPLGIKLYFRAFGDILNGVIMRKSQEGLKKFATAGPVNTPS